MYVEVPSLSPPNGQDFWTTPTEDGRPVFSASVVATVFFGHRKLWLYRQLYANRNVLDGEVIEIPRAKTQDKYQFQLGHIERIAHALFERGVIDVKVFENALLIVKSVASNYGLI